MSARSEKSEVQDQFGRLFFDSIEWTAEQYENCFWKAREK